MYGKLPSLSALRAFEAAARHLSFTAASRELFVTQGAISHQVRALEDELGYALFRRRPRQVELTEEGEALKRAVTRALGTIVKSLRQIEDQRGAGQLTVSLPASFAVKYFVPRLELFSRLHPDIEVRISATNRLVAADREGIDLCIRFGQGPYKGYDCELLVTEDVFAVCSPQLLKLTPVLASPADLTGHTLLHDVVLEEHPDRMSWPRYLSEIGVDVDASYGPRFSHTAMSIAAAIAGQGVALARACLVADDLSAGRLVRPFGPSVPSPFSYWLLAPIGGLKRPAVAALVSWIRGDVAEAVRQVEALRTRT